MNRFHYAATERESHQDLFDVCANRSRGNPESRAAFESIRDRLTEQQERVINAIRQSDDGLTAEEIATKLGTTVNCVSGRCSELKMQGRITTKGRRLTRSGNPAAVLVLASQSTG